MGDFLDQFDKIPTGQKALLLVLLSAGMFVAFYLLVYSGLEDEIKQADVRERALVARRAELVAVQGDIDRIRADIEGLCERQSSFLEKLPPRAEISSLLQQIHQQAQLVGLDIVRFERMEDVPGANYTTIPVEMEIRGTFDQIADFFYFIGRQRRIVNVGEIDLQLSGETSPTGSNAGGPPRLVAKYVVSTYFTDAAGTEGGQICAQQTQPQQ